MNRQEILEKMEELEELLYETDEEQEKLDEYRKQAKFGAKSIKIMMEEFEKEGLDKAFAIELLKLGIGNLK